MARTDTKPPLVVCDAGPLIHLDEVGCMDLLSDFAEILIPEAVLVEVQRHRPGALAAAGNLGIQTHGTIGILVRAIRRKSRTKEEILTILRSLPERSTLHLKRSLLDQVISEIE